MNRKTRRDYKVPKYKPLTHQALKDADVVYCGSCCHKMQKWYIYCPLCGKNTLLNKLSEADAKSLADDLYNTPETRQLAKVLEDLDFGI
jgi:predicted amidophosphoribosyltransferase